MRIIFGALSLLIVMAVVGVLAKKQLSALPAIAAPVGASSAISPGATQQMRSQQIQQQVKQQVEAAMQARPLPDDAK